MLSNFERFRADRAGVGFVLVVFVEQFFVLVLVDAFRGTFDLTKVDWYNGGSFMTDDDVFLLDFFVVLLMLVLLLVVLELDAVLASVEEGKGVP